MKKRTTELFIFIFTALAFSYFSTSKAGTCSSISRTNFSANSVLTSTELNSQFNGVYAQVNDLDGGCLTDGTLEFSSLNTSDFQPILNNVIGGCKVTRASVSSVSISPCSMTINGNTVNKTSSTTLSMGCGDCSAETATTTYYVYVKGDSTGSTLNAFFSTVAPDTLGLNGTAKVLAKVRNDSNSDLYQYGIDQWKINGFHPTSYGVVDDGTITIAGSITNPTKGTGIYNDKMKWTRQGENALINMNFAQSDATGSAGIGAYIFDLPDGLSFIDGTNYTSPSISTLATIDAYGSVYARMYDAGTTDYMYAETYVIPFTATSFFLYVNSASISAGSNPQGGSVGSSAFRLDEATILRGQFLIPVDAFKE